MDPRRYSLLGHGDLPWWNPVEGAAFDGWWPAPASPQGRASSTSAAGTATSSAGPSASSPGATGVGVDRALVPAAADPRIELREEAFAAANPSDPDAPAILARLRPWREGYLRWGRTTLGFALLLFRRSPGAPNP